MRRDETDERRYYIFGGVGGNPSDEKNNVYGKNIEVSFSLFEERKGMNQRLEGVLTERRRFDLGAHFAVTTWKELWRNLMCSEVALVL